MRHVRSSALAVFLLLFITSLRGERSFNYMVAEALEMKRVQEVVEGMGEGLEY